jgi:hypothetical protein
MWAQEATRRNGPRICEGVCNGRSGGAFFVCFMGVGGVDGGEQVAEGVVLLMRLGEGLGEINSIAEVLYTAMCGLLSSPANPENVYGC